MNIKKGDKVLVNAGKSKGSQGVVEKIVRETNRVVVTGVNMRKKHVKPSKSSPRGGIIEYPAPFSRDNVIVVCPHCSKPTRIGNTVGADNKKYRFCIHCKGSLDVL